MTHVESDLLLAEASDSSTSEEHDRVSRHLEECTDCLDRFAGYCAELTILETALRPRHAGGARLLIAAAILPFALVLGWVLWTRGRGEPVPPQPRDLESRAPDVQSPLPDPQAQEASFSSMGLLHPSREVSIFSKVQAHVARVDVARGARVKTGDLLIELRAPELEALAQEARVRLAQDEAELQRVKALVSRAVAAASELDAATAKAAIDKARLATCEANLSYLRIVAPFDGIIADRAVEEGSLVGPPAGTGSEALLHLQNIDRLRLTVSLPASSEPTLDHVSRGDRVAFIIREQRDKKMVATYLGSPRTVDPNTGCFSVDLEVDNAALGLLPGMLAWVAWPPSK